MTEATHKPRLLTGDTPTGRLHLGHYTGTLENRLSLQEQYECYFILANKHAFTTLLDKPETIRRHTLEVALDWLAVGIDPEKSSMFIQSEVHEIDELTFYFSMLLPFNRVMRNPTLKSEIINKGLGDAYPFGFPLYAVGQTADILAFRPDIVPVGKDQLPHIEMTREVAHRFNHLYESDSETSIFPDVQPMLGRVDRLVGLNGPAEDGTLQKMSKSLNNAILLSDSAEEVRQKVMSMYTDPTRLRATDPGHIENNPLWALHDAFNKDKQWVEEFKEKYRTGNVGDVQVKKQLVSVINDFLEPIRERRVQYENNEASVIEILKAGTEKARIVAQETIEMVKDRIGQKYW
ncbi:MAG: Tryptophan--tRNA ligase 2 [Candidatus Celerinatantimonas neptuna]|nr:MAG: Tryptophan--tRNA ligase 2 [Candidatus Celerinatantimonas neptuna]